MVPARRICQASKVTAHVSRWVTRPKKNGLARHVGCVLDAGTDFQTLKIGGRCSAWSGYVRSHRDRVRTLLWSTGGWLRFHIATGVRQWAVLGGLKAHCMKPQYPIKSTRQAEFDRLIWGNLDKAQGANPRVRRRFIAVIKTHLWVDPGEGLRAVRSSLPASCLTGIPPRRWPTCCRRRCQRTF